jgi:glycerol-3-phosphate dehydrogenase
VVAASWERKILRGVAPHLIKPKPIYLVLGKTDKRSSLSVLAGVWTYYLLQISQGQFFSPPVFFLRKESIKNRFPELSEDQVKAVFRFWDSETDDARLVIENLQDANARGGHALNYVEVVGFQKSTEGVSVTLRHQQSQEEIHVLTKLLVNASGPFVDEVRGRTSDGKPSQPLLDRVAGAHIDVYPAITPNSFYITAADQRLVFVLRRSEDGVVYSRIGTTERPLSPSESSDHPVATQTEIDYLKAAVKEFLPTATLANSSIVRMDAGIRPLRAQNDLDPFQKSREHDLVMEDRLIHVVGVKLTDYRRVAKEFFSMIPWEKWGIPVSNRDKDLSAITPLRLGSSEKMYAESTVDDMVSKTAPLHWGDVLFRRRGLAPRLEARTNPARLEADFERMRTLLGWDAATAASEKKNLS